MQISRNSSQSSVPHWRKLVVQLFRQPDADVLIVQTAGESVKLMDTILGGDDTDLMVLLIYHVDMAAHEVYLNSKSKKNAKKTRVWNIKKTKDSLGSHVCSNLLFMHAILGCDTTSRVDRIGKPVALTKIQHSAHF